MILAKPLDPGDENRIFQLQWRQFDPDRRVQGFAAFARALLKASAWLT